MVDIKIQDVTKPEKSTPTTQTPFSFACLIYKDSTVYSINFEMKVFEQNLKQSLIKFISSFKASF